MTRVLVLAAHPDDEVLGMGGTIAVHVDRGDEVRVVVVTDGSSTQYPDDAEIRARKEDEALRAAAELGVTDYVHLDLPDMRLDTLPHVEVNRVVEEHVRDFAPERVYTPHPDVNRDHRVLFDSVAVATRPVPARTVRRLLTYAPTSSTEWTPAALNWFVPNWFVEVTGTSSGRWPRSPTTRPNAASTRIRAASARSARHRSSTARAAAASTRSHSFSCAGSSRSSSRLVARWPQLLLVLALLGATAAAFAVTERLKLERSPITGTQVDRVFSPVCECARDVAVISFILRRRETVTLDMLNKNGRSIRTVVRKLREPAGRVSYTWDGRDNLDRVVPEGVYRPRVQLERNGRTIVLPNPIRVDTTAPRITLVRVLPRVFSPDSDGNRDRVTATYRIDERARAVMLVDGRQRVQSKFRALEGKLVWFGRINGRVVPPGMYEIRLRAVDRAGNRSVRTRAVPVRVRFVELSRERIEAVAGKRFSVRVRTDADSYRWLFAGRRGVGTRQVLVLRAPDEPGSYALYVTVGGRAARAAVEVVAPE